VGALFIVATPIGNLSDISPRALDALRSADLIACEDTRQTLKLLNHFGIQKPLISYHDFNEEKKAAALGEKIQAGQTIALVSDAGTPGISDPGFRLVRYCREHELTVTPIPGPNAAIAALSASGLPSDEFFFAGFLPSKKTARREKLETLRSLRGTLVFYEAPHRIEGTLTDLLEILGDREACVGRELTKLHEEFLFGKISTIRDNVKVLGEFVVVVAGNVGSDDKPRIKAPLTRERVLKTLGISRNELYDLFFKK
jgi:16S rRNA (cytidine1402-2'-O)-methyltransferase